MSSRDADRDLLTTVRAELAPRDAENTLIPLVTTGRARRSVFGAIGVRGDRGREAAHRVEPLT